jgi:hypothetical protein
VEDQFTVRELAVMLFLARGSQDIFDIAREHLIEATRELRMAKIRSASPCPRDLNRPSRTQPTSAGLYGLPYIRESRPSK